MLLENGAGGKFRVSGDYLYRSFHSFGFDGGLWSIFRVQPSFVSDPCYCPPGQLCTLQLCKKPLEIF
jgi:hypothetical protein